LIGAVWGVVPCATPIVADEARKTVSKTFIDIVQSSAMTRLGVGNPADWPALSFPSNVDDCPSPEGELIAVEPCIDARQRHAGPALNLDRLHMDLLMAP